jgi:restriction endonuclease Mrr
LKDSFRDQDWKAVRDVLLIVVTQRWAGQSQEAVAEYVDENIAYVAEHLRDESAQALHDGAVCPFEIDNEEDPYIRSHREDDGALLLKLKRICPYDFEKVCAKLISSIGADSKVTSKTRDGGVDFIAVGLDILPSELNCPSYCRASVIGQAKRFGSRLIAEKSLREFVGASLLHRNELRVNQSIAPLSPVLLAFWTTSNFEANTKIFARRAGVWLMDGYTLSTYLIRLGLTDWVMAMDDLDPA